MFLYIVLYKLIHKTILIPNWINGQYTHLNINGCLWLSLHAFLSLRSNILNEGHVYFVNPNNKVYVKIIEVFLIF